MRIKRLKLKNFRCFGAEETIIDLEDLTALIGINSSGKTAVLHALVKLFGRSASVRELRRADFHVPKGKQPEDLSEQHLYIEAVIDFPELDNDDNTDKNTVPLLFQHMTVDGIGESPYCRMRLEADWRKSNTPEGEIDQRHVFITAPENEEGEELGEHKRPVSAHYWSMMEVIYVPAIRDPSSQLRNAAGTILWRVLNGINWPENIDGQIKGTSDELEKIFEGVSGFSKLEEVMGKQWRNLHSDLRYNRVKVTFSNDDLNAVLRKLDVRFFPTEIPGSYDVDALGEGLRSLFYLSLVSSLLEIEAIASQERATPQSTSAEEESKSPRIFNPDFEPPVLTILAVEEPENHIAPHLLGRVMERLHQAASQPNAQVVVTSHTPAIVARVEPESIRHLRICKDRLCSISSPIRIPDEVEEAHKYVKEAVRAYPEIYFARLVVLGEGDTEEIIIPKALKSLGPSLDASGICVVPLGGRFVNHFWRLLTEIDIPYITLLDLDLGRHDGGWARIQYVIKELIHNGISRAQLVSTMGEHDICISDEGLDSIRNWDEDREAIELWLRALESYDVFFASSLDIDFMMLQSFKDPYQAIAPEGGGPRIPNRHSHPNAFRERLDQAVRATLKADNVGRSLYGEDEELLMVWYVYLFLNRGKPSTHILALSKMSDEEYEKYLPQPIVRLRERVKTKLANDPFSQLSINEKK